MVLTSYCEDRSDRSPEPSHQLASTGILMNPTFYQFLAGERIAGYRREADARRLGLEIVRRPHTATPPPAPRHLRPARGESGAV